jgi:hypothetical protein
MGEAAMAPTTARREIPAPSCANAPSPYRLPDAAHPVCPFNIRQFNIRQFNIRR